MKRFFLGVLVFSFSLQFIGISGAIAVLPGSNCPKVGISTVYKGKKYTCVKSKKGLFWNNGIIIKNAQPKPSQTIGSKPIQSATPSPSNSQPKPVFQPWALNINQQILIDASSAEFRKWANLNSTSTHDVIYIIDSKLDSANLDWIKNSVALSLKAFGADAPSVYTVIVGKSCDWIIQKSSAPCEESKGNLYFSDSVSKSFFVLSNVSQRSQLRSSDLQTAAHEFFHSVQGRLGGGNWNSRVPAWFIEGTAMFFGLSFSDLSENSPYLTGRFEETWLRDYQTKTYLPLSKYTYENFDPRGSYQNPYGIGLIATEFIVGSVGIPRLLDIFRNLGTGASFSDSFLTATGISLEDFYSKFEGIRDYVGMPHGK